MTYGKNQQALLKFLEKHPDRCWHRIKRRKAIDAAKRLSNNRIEVGYRSFNRKSYAMYSLPQLLKEQA